MLPYSRQPPVTTPSRTSIFLVSDKPPASAQPAPPPSGAHQTFATPNISAERDTVDRRLVTQALADFSEVFAEINPYQQKQLMRLVLHKAILGPDYMKMALIGRRPGIGPLTEGEPHFQTFKRLPGPPSQSALLWDHLALRIKRIGRGQMKIAMSLPSSSVGGRDLDPPEAAQITSQGVTGCGHFIEGT